MIEQLTTQIEDIEYEINQNENDIILNNQNKMIY